MHARLSAVWRRLLVLSGCLRPRLRGDSVVEPSDTGPARFGANDSGHRFFMASTSRLWFRA
jgi:hypothetical protein